MGTALPNGCGPSSRTIFYSTPQKVPRNDMSRDRSDSPDPNSILHVEIQSMEAPSCDPQDSKDLTPMSRTWTPQIPPPQRSCVYACIGKSTSQPHRGPPWIIFRSHPTDAQSDLDVGNWEARETLLSSLSRSSDSGSTHVPAGGGPVSWGDTGGLVGGGVGAWSTGVF